MNAISIEAVKIAVLRALNIARKVELVLIDVDNCPSGTCDYMECAIRDGGPHRGPRDLDCAPHTQSVWGRFGLTLRLTDTEFSALMEGGENAYALIRGKIERGEFILNGETYFPATETSQPDVWPINDDIQFEF